MNKNKEQFYIISPDGFSIEIEKTYATPKQAWQAFEEWKKRFSRQGYYSTVKNGQRLQIPLEELEKYCKLKSI